MGREDKKRKEQENKERRTPGANRLDSHRVRRKGRYTEIEKDKSPEAKGSWGNLRRTGKKQAKLRPGNHN